MIVRRSLCGCLTKFNLEGLLQNEQEIYEDLVGLSEDLLQVYCISNLKEVNGDLVSTNAIKRYIYIVLTIGSINCSSK